MRVLPHGIKGITEQFGENNNNNNYIWGCFQSPDLRHSAPYFPASAMPAVPYIQLKHKQLSFSLFFFLAANGPACIELRGILLYC